MAAAAVLLAGCGGEGVPGENGADVSAAAPTAAAAEPAPAARPPAAAEPAAGTDSAAPANVPILAEAFTYGATEDRNFVGYFAAPEEIVEPLPGIVLVHERWGLDDSIKSLARDLAGAGYAVMAVDLFGGATAAGSAGAQVLVDAATADREGLLNNIAQAIDYLRAYALAPRVAVVGFGLGGGLALETAVTSPEKIDAVVSYYGRLIFDEAELARLRAPLLGLYADLDESVPVRDVQSFRRLLRELGNDSDVFLYLDVPHGFADPGRATFDSQAAGEAWQELIDFLGTTLGRG